MTTNKTYKYGMKLRGFSIGCQPLKGLIDASEDPEGKFYNILTYDRELTDEELEEYELEDLAPKIPNLKIVRTKFGISQRKLAKAAGLKNPRQVEFWEAKKGRFNGAAVESALAVADILGVDVRELLD